MLVNSEKIILTWNLMKRSRKKIKIKMSSPEPTSQTAEKICLTFFLDDFLMFSDRKWWNCHKRMFGCLLTFYLHQKKSFWKVFSRTKLHKTLWDVTRLLECILDTKILFHSDHVTYFLLLSLKNYLKQGNQGNIIIGSAPCWRLANPRTRRSAGLWAPQ